MGYHVAGMKDAPTAKSIEDGKYKGRVKTAVIEEKTSKDGNPYHQLIVTYEILDGPLQQGKYDAAGRNFPYYCFLPTREGAKDENSYIQSLSILKTYIVNHGIPEEDITDDLEAVIENMIGCVVSFEKVETPQKNNPQYTNVRLNKLKPAPVRGE